MLTTYVPHWYGSFHSDYSYDLSEAVTNLAFTRWDLWHLGGGFSADLGSNEFTVGLIYAFSPLASVRQIGDRSTSKYQRLTLILGFNLPFGDMPTPG